MGIASLLMLSTLAGFYYKAHVCRTYGARFFAVSLTQPLRASNGRPQRPRRKIDAWGTHLKQKAGPFRAGRNLRSRCPAGRLGMTGVGSHDGLSAWGDNGGVDVQSLRGSFGDLLAKPSRKHALRTAAISSCYMRVRFRSDRRA